MWAHWATNYSVAMFKTLSLSVEWGLATQVFKTTQQIELLRPEYETNNSILIPQLVNSANIVYDLSVCRLQY